MAEQSTKENPVIDPTTEENPVIDPTTEENPVIDPTTKENPVIDPTTEENPVIDPTTEENPVIDPTTEENPVVDPTTEENPVVDPTMEVRTVVDADGTTLGGLLRLTTGPVAVDVMLTYPSAAALTAALVKVLSHRPPEDDEPAKDKSKPPLSTHLVWCHDCSTFIADGEPDKWDAADTADAHRDEHPQHSTQVLVEVDG